jgi:hypothetical protein
VLVDELTAPCFVVKQLLEPMPDEAVREADQAAYEKLAQQPGFLMALLR